MSRKLWILVTMLLVLAVLAAGAGIWAFFFLREFRAGRALDRAEACVATGETRMAKRNYAYYLAQHPNNIDVLRRYARVTLEDLMGRQDALRDASAAYYQIATHEPDNDATLRSLIELQEKRRSWSDLEYYASYFMKRYPERTWIPYYRALALDQLGRTQDAIKAYRDLIEAGTDRPEVYGNLAHLLAQDGLAVQALEVLDQAHQQQPDNFHIDIQRARYFMEMRDPDRAEQALQEATARNADDADVQLMATRVALVRNRLDDAVVHGERAVHAAPDRFEPYMLLASAYQAHGETAKACSLLQNMDPYLRADNPELFLLWCELLVQDNRFDEMHAALELFRLAWPDYLPTFQYLEARELLARGNAAEAAAKLTTVVETMPAFQQAQYYLVLACLQSYQRDQAHTALEAYVRKYPDEPQGRALFDQEFGPGQSLPKVTTAAEQVLANNEATADQLVMAARQMLRAASRQDALDSSASTAKQLIEKALQKDPASAAAYQTLAELLTSQKDAAGAQAALDRAAAAGVPKTRLYLPRAFVALLNSDIAQAQALYAEASSQPDTTMDNTLRWAGLFADNGHLEEGLTVLTRALENAKNPDERATLGRECVALCMRHGQLDKALENLSRLEAQATDAPDVRRALNNQKEQLVRVFLRPGPTRNLEQAKRLIEELRRDDPARKQVALLQAQVLMSQDPPDYAAARAIVNPLHEASPNDAYVTAMLADIAAREGNLNQALDYAERAASGAPHDIPAQLGLGEMQMRTGAFKEAQATLERVLTLHPNDVRAMELLTDVYIALDRFQQAESMLGRLEKALGDEGADRLAALRVKLIVARGDKPQEAEAMLRKQYEEKPDDFNAVRQLAAAMEKQDRKTEAENLLKTFAEQHGDKPDPWVVLGQHYLTKGDPESLTRASSALTRALLIDRNYPPALRAMIGLQLAENNPTDALVLCDRYLGMQPDDAEVLYYKAHLQVLQGQAPAEALATIQHALTIAEKPEYIYVRGCLYLEQGQYTRALEDLQQVKPGPRVDAAELDLALAEAYLGAGERDLAQRYYDSGKQKATSRGPAMMQRVERVAKLLKGESS